MKYLNLFRIVFFNLFLSMVAFAVQPIQVQVDQAVKQGSYNLGVGSQLTMSIPDSKTEKIHGVEGVFLGKLIEPSGEFSKFMFLDVEKTRVYLVDRTDAEIGKYNFQPILRPYDQVGGTCGAYAINHYFQQMHWSENTGNGELEKTLSTEKGRTQLLANAINEYYLNAKNISFLGVMKKFGNQFGFKCKMKMFTEAEEAKVFMREKIKSGLPVLVNFETGPDMVSSTYEIVEYGKKKSLKDNRLWLPRKSGERKSGGHSMVAAAMFESKGREKFLMLDSDWSEPRVWDTQNYLGDKTVIEEIEFITCE